jgi:DNA modification methylase
VPNGLPDLIAADIHKIANSPSKDSGYTRTYYSYPAKFQAQLPHKLVALTTRKGDMVFDPYSGGGTTGLECLVLERHFVGYDLNPFAILISKVKTSKLDTRTLLSFLAAIEKIKKTHNHDIFDELDKECLGKKIADDVNGLLSNIQDLDATQPYKAFFKLALIHTIKIIGRRDFSSERRSSTGDLFSLHEAPRESVRSLFQKKVRNMAFQMTALPKNKTKPAFICASNHVTSLEAKSVDLIVTSPPYKDLDVEYGLIQIQRRELKRSKRSEVIWRILGVNPIGKDLMCGFKSENYWTNLAPSLIECRRVLKDDHLAFFWTGFKAVEDRYTFVSYLEQASLAVVETIPVKLSEDRVASSRSTHHNKNTGMLKEDYLFISRAV